MVWEFERGQNGQYATVPESGQASCPGTSGFLPCSRLRGPGGEGSGLPVGAGEPVCRASLCGADRLGGSEL